MVRHDASSPKTILLVDDDGPLQKFVAASLVKCGYNLIFASDGKEALQKSKDFHGEIHLLLTDVELPGMTGIELSIQLNRERPDAKILMISGLDSGLLILNNGWQFFPKPFMADMLRDKIRDFLTEEPRVEARMKHA